MDERTVLFPATHPEGAFFAVEPEVVGASFTGSPDSPAFTFDTWLGDELVRVQPHFLAVARLRKAIEAIKPRGIRFEKVSVRTSPYFRRYSPGVRVPRFFRLIVEGIPGRGDAFVTAGSVLVVSRSLLDVLVRFHIPRAVFSQHQTERATQSLNRSPSITRSPRPRKTAKRPERRPTRGKKNPSSPW